MHARININIVNCISKHNNKSKTLAFNERKKEHKEKIYVRKETVRISYKQQ
jgi:hypothetical protein